MRYRMDTLKLSLQGRFGPRSRSNWTDATYQNPAFRHATFQYHFSILGWHVSSDGPSWMHAWYILVDWRSRTPRTMCKALASLIFNHHHSHTPDFNGGRWNEMHWNEMKWNEILFRKMIKVGILMDKGRRTDHWNNGYVLDPKAKSLF